MSKTEATATVTSSEVAKRVLHSGSRPVKGRLARKPAMKSAISGSSQESST